MNKRTISSVIVLVLLGLSVVFVFNVHADSLSLLNITSISMHNTDTINMNIGVKHPNDMLVIVTGGLTTDVSFTELHVTSVTGATRVAPNFQIGNHATCDTARPCGDIELWSVIPSMAGMLPLTVMFNHPFQDGGAYVYEANGVGQLQTTAGSACRIPTNCTYQALVDIPHSSYFQIAGFVTDSTCSKVDTVIFNDYTLDSDNCSATNQNILAEHANNPAEWSNTFQFINAVQPPTFAFPPPSFHTWALVGATWVACLCDIGSSSTSFTSNTSTTTYTTTIGTTTNTITTTTVKTTAQVQITVLTPTITATTTDTIFTTTVIDKPQFFNLTTAILILAFLAAIAGAIRMAWQHKEET